MLLDGNRSAYLAFNELKLQDEKAHIESFLHELEFLQGYRTEIKEQTKVWVQKVRKKSLPIFNFQRLLQTFPLSHEQGRALMGLAEAYLRIPDPYTATLILKDKITELDWGHEKFKKGIISTFSHWALNLLGYVQDQRWVSFAQPSSLWIFKTLLDHLSQEFILGQTMAQAQKSRLKMSKERISFDMLGESARTFSMAKSYKNSYIHAIKIIGAHVPPRSFLIERDSISIKLSALHPHYHFLHHQEIMRELLPILIELCVLARQVGVGITIDAEEAAQLELSLDLIKAATESNELKGWEGFGFAVQAYQKCAPAIIEWAENLSIKLKMPLMLRLVKGAYWDTEIKNAQVGGYAAYPVFTRKATTDLCYLACAHKLLNNRAALYPQFGTHNAHTIAAILAMAKGRRNFEFQRLYGMGEELHKIVRQNYPIASRVYAPVGKVENLLPYLIRRLLENGAGSSFVYKIYHSPSPVEEVIEDPWDFFDNHSHGRHPSIPLPIDIYEPQRKNSKGFDLNDGLTIEKLYKEIAESKPSPPTVPEVNLEDLDIKLKAAHSQWKTWDQTPANQRASILNRAADLMEDKRGLFLGLLIQEGKKTLPDAVSELREAVDYCRYYAAEALNHFETPQHLRSPTGERNELILRGRGVFACISPWNFPMAIFTGQVVAALAAGNGVIAKPATFTPLTGFHVIQTLYEAGIPEDILHFLPGSSKIFGSALVKDPRISGIVFTGSMEVAQQIQKNLAERIGPIIPFIAETGGINAMIVDSSAVIEQVVDDVIASAFQSAGQRCSALRILFIQEDIYMATLQMLKEAMEALHVGDPAHLSTDVGPVIDSTAQKEIENYIAMHPPLSRTNINGLKGTFVAPTLIEVKGMHDVPQEVFGPVLHVTSFKAKNLDYVIQTINESGYGLTMGLHSRIDATINKVRSKTHAGNLYINRSIIGAVVGVQPFGGEGLSGTGPKAGGPYYLPHFAIEKAFTYDITASVGNVSLLNLIETPTALT